MTHINSETKNFVSGSSGVIELDMYSNDYHQIWEVRSSCSSVQLLSTTFSTEANFDWLRVDDIGEPGGSAVSTSFACYSGYAVEVNQHVGSTFTVTFTSDATENAAGFRFEWSCYSDSSSAMPYNKPQDLIVCSVDYNVTQSSTQPTLLITNSTDYASSSVVTKEVYIQTGNFYTHFLTQIQPGGSVRNSIFYNPNLPNFLQEPVV